MHTEYLLHSVVCFKHFFNWSYVVVNADVKITLFLHNTTSVGVVFLKYLSKLNKITAF